MREPSHLSYHDLQRIVESIQGFQNRLLGLDGDNAPKSLRELYDRYGSDNHLSLDNYHALGDTKEDLTPLENAVRKAADDVLADAAANGTRGTNGTAVVTNPAPEVVS